jgi:hypothetical protein
MRIGDIRIVLIAPLRTGNLFALDLNTGTIILLGVYVMCIQFIDIIMHYSRIIIILMYRYWLMVMNTANMSKLNKQIFGDYKLYNILKRL